MTSRWSVCLLALLLLSPAPAAMAQPPGPRPPGERGAAILPRYQTLLQQAKDRGEDTSEAEALARQSAALRKHDRETAEQLMRAAIEKLQPGQSSTSRPLFPPGRDGIPARPDSTDAGPRQPVFLLAFTHHYNGPGGYYPSAAEVRAIGEFFVKAGIPGTLFFDGILVERLLKEDPALIQQIREWNLPLGYHGEETHGPYPVASELLGEAYTLKEAQGYQGPWSLTTGQDWDAAVKLVEERYSFARPYRIDETDHRIDRRQPSATDRSRIGGLKLVQQAFGKDVAMMTSHSLESAPEGYAFRRMSQFGFDQPAVPVALHALKIFHIGEVADQIMAIAGENESIFWYMGRLHCKGDDDGEAGYHTGFLRHSLDILDRSRPRLLLVGFSHIDEAEGLRTAQYLKERFFPQNPGSAWVTGDTLANQFEPEKSYRPTTADQTALARAITTGWQARPPDLLALGDRVYSLADAFEALARSLVQRDASGALPATVELHPLYGPIAENGAPLLRGETDLAVSSIQAAARAMLETMDRGAGDRFVPVRVSVAGQNLNAGEFLYAMAAAILAGPGDTVRVPPSNLFPPYADLLQSVFKPKAIQPVCYTQGQLWTVKPVRLKATSSVSATPAAAVPVAAATDDLPRAIRVVFASNLESDGGCHREDPSGADLFRVDFDLGTGKASDLKQLTSRAGPDWFPALLPNGRLVAYDRTETAGPGGRARHDLWQFDLAKDKEQPLVESARFPAFDAAANHLYYSPQLRGGDHQLLRAGIRPATDAVLRLGTPELIADQRVGAELVEDPAPLPDGSAVVFHRKETAQGAGLAIIPAGGGDAQALTPFDGCGHASVSPDGQAVACTRSRDGRIVVIRRSASGWQPPRDLPVSSDPQDYVTDDSRFGSVREVRHSYVEWIAPRLLLVSTHGAEGPKDFRFARLYLFVLGANDSAPPRRIDLSAAIESLAGKRSKDFCTADALPRP